MVTKNLSKKQELISINSRKIDRALNSLPYAAREQYFNDLLIDELQVLMKLKMYLVLNKRLHMR